MTILTAILNTLVVLICFFLICLILIQRGRGGGLAGAFGGVGGSSAFGTKAGDVFTRVTVILASMWILLSMLLVILYNQGGSSAWGTDTNSPLTSEVRTSKTKSQPGKAVDLPGDGKAPTGPASSGTPAPSAAPASSPTAPVGVPAIPDAASEKPAAAK